MSSPAATRTLSAGVVQRLAALALTAALAASAWAFPEVGIGFLLAAALAAWFAARPERGLTVFIWLLPFHIVTMAFLFGGLGLAGPVVRSLAAWKEALIALVLGAVIIRALTGIGAKSKVIWLDLCAAGLGVLAFAYLVAANQWFGSDVPLAAQAYGFRDAFFFMLLYFAGRATPQITQKDRILKHLFVIGTITSVIGILERILVPAQALVILGGASYFQEFLGIAAYTGANEFGLPDNYWTVIGGRLVRRAGSTYLSSQGFAIPFLILMPAATVWLLSARERARAPHWIGYAAMWIGLLLTITRMTIIACVIETLLLCALLRRWNLAAAMLAVGTVIGIGAMLAVPGLAGYVWDTLTWQTSSGRTHLDAWLRGLAAMAEYPLGAGLATTDQTAIRFGLTPLTGDNQFLKYAVELGILGFALHLAVLGGIGAYSLRLWRSQLPDRSRSYGAVVAAATLGIALNSLTAVLYNSMVLSYVYFWLAGSVVGRQLSASAQKSA